MFVDALETVGGYTRPVFTIARRYNTSDIAPGSATLFFINEEGWALTTRHIAKMIRDASAIDEGYNAFRRDRAAINPNGNYDDELKLLEIKYNLSEKKVAQMKVSFFDCVDRFNGFELKVSNKYDLAAIHLTGYTKVLYKGYAIFSDGTDDVRPGKFLCRVGYPFPEFQNYEYAPEDDEIIWTGNGQRNSSRFPAEAMMTRLTAGREGINGIELNAQAMLGLNGAPLFDEKGLVHGMQIGSNKTRLTVCLHSAIIRDFLERQHIPYYVSNRRDIQMVPPVKRNSIPMGTVIKSVQKVEG